MVAALAFVAGRSSSSDQEALDEAAAQDQVNSEAIDPGSETANGSRSSESEPEDGPPSDEEEAENCSVITSTLTEIYLPEPPQCLDYTAGSEINTGTIPNGWLVVYGSEWMSSADPSHMASVLSDAQMEFPEATIVDSRLYGGLRDATWAVVVPAYSEEDALEMCGRVPDPGCTARHTDLTLDELRAGVRP